jgi:hypothetical protein
LWPSPLTQDTAKLGEELQVLASAPSPLIAAQERRAERAADTGKFEKLIENLVVSECGVSWLGWALSNSLRLNAELQER